MHVNLVALRAEFLSGNNSFLETVSDRYSLYCIRYMSSKHACSREQAQDIFIEAVLEFRKGVINRQIKDVKNVRSYLLGTCLNKFQKELRSKKRDTEKYAEIKEHLYQKSPNFLDSTIEAEYKQELTEITLKSFNQLDKPCQELLRLFYVSGLSMKEIAEEMDFASDKVAKTTKSRCYKKWIAELVRLNELSQKPSN